MDKDPSPVTSPTPPADPVDGGRSRIFIGADGEVVVENLTPALLEVALALDPEDARLRAIAQASGADVDAAQSPIESVAVPVAPAPGKPTSDGDVT